VISNSQRKNSLVGKENTFLSLCRERVLRLVFSANERMNGMNKTLVKGKQTKYVCDPFNGCGTISYHAYKKQTLSFTDLTTKVYSISHGV